MRTYIISIMFFVYAGVHAQDYLPSWESAPDLTYSTTCYFDKVLGENKPYTCTLSPNPKEELISNYSHESSSGIFYQVPSGHYILSTTDRTGDKKEYKVFVNIDYSTIAGNDTLYIKVPCKGGFKNRDTIINVIKNDHIIIKTAIDNRNSVPIYREFPGGEAIFKLLDQSRSDDIKPIGKNSFSYKVKENISTDYDSFDYEVDWNGHKSTATVTVFFIKEMPKMGDIHVDKNTARFSATNGEPSYTYVINDNTNESQKTSSGEIHNLPFGTYTVYAIDENQCESGKKTFFISKAIYPAAFFSPDGDGTNDTWTILNIKEFNLFRIRILTREGKLIKEYINNYIPWDGTCDGKEMPCGDYWYIMDSEETDQCFSGHFTLIRGN